MATDVADLKIRVDFHSRAIEDIREQIRILTSLCMQTAEAVSALSVRMDMSGLER